MQQLTTGTLLQGGKYKIEHVLGQGGFGITYLAEQVMLGRKVAVKEFFMKELCDRDETTSHVTLGTSGSRETVIRFREKFLKEARMIACMSNSHIVPIYDIFEENGTAYYIMENIDGGSLDSIIKEQPLQEAQALKYIREIADALQYIHNQNILHLDIKPSNILLRKNGEAVLIDFGISKRYDDQGGQTSTTPAGISKGYAPTEQYNQGIANFSPATDIYSLGATLYKMLTGTTPPEASLLLNEDEELIRPNSVSFATWCAIEKAMEPRRKRRPQTISEFLSLLDEVPCAMPLKEEKTIGNVTEETQIVGVGTDKNNIQTPTENIQEETVLSVEKKQIATKEEVDLCSKYGLPMNSSQPVDLGLSILWGSCNIGTDCPTSSGILSEWKNYKIIDSHNWRLPSTEEFKELKEECNWKWIGENGIKGYLVTSPKTGNKIFLRASGKEDGCNSINDEIGFYWSKDQSTSPEYAYCTTFMLGTVLCYIKNPYRYRMSLRPVCSG